MKRILFLIEWFEPAFKAGGPIRSVSNMAKMLQDDYEVFIFTGDRDILSEQVLHEVELDRWLNYDRKIRVFYCRKERLGWRKVLGLIKDLHPDYIYCSGLYARSFVLYPILAKRLGRVSSKLIVSPHGMLKPSALSVKPLKKKVFFTVSKLAGLYSGLHFHATDAGEESDIRNVFGNMQVTQVADAPDEREIDNSLFLEKVPGKCRIVFVGRLHPIKNLRFLLLALRNVSCDIDLSVVGVIEDPEYWRDCEAIATTLPKNISVSYLGGLPHGEVLETIAANHLFCLPTKGENYGHAVFEALSSSRPVLVSDQTPWRNLEAYFAGWDISLDSTDKFSDIISLVAGMDQEEWLKYCIGAQRFARSYRRTFDCKEKYLKMFS